MSLTLDEHMWVVLCGGFEGRGCDLGPQVGGQCSKAGRDICTSKEVLKGTVSGGLESTHLTRGDPMQVDSFIRQIPMEHLLCITRLGGSNVFLV